MLYRSSGLGRKQMMSVSLADLTAAILRSVKQMTADEKSQIRRELDRGLGGSWMLEKSVCLKCGVEIRRVKHNDAVVFEHLPHIGPFPNTACRFPGMPDLENSGLHATPEIDLLFTQDDLKFLHQTGICLTD
jgi:hypothetical protein